MHLPGDRQRVREFAVITALDLLRHRLLERDDAVMIAPATARRVWETLEPLHASVYFAPEPAEAFAKLGLKGFWMGYVASRAAPMGPVGPAVVEATFARLPPVADPARAARRVEPGPTRGDHRRRGSRRPAAPSSACSTARRPVARSRWWATCCSTRWSGPTRWDDPIFAAHLALDRPEDPTGRVWHAATVFREHRGDGHVAALTAEGVNGCASHVLAVGRGVTDRSTQQGARRWSDEEWADAVEGLHRRGLVNEDGSLTVHGHDLVVHIEAVTDRRSAEALEPLGDGADATPLRGRARWPGGPWPTARSRSPTRWGTPNPPGCDREPVRLFVAVRPPPEVIEVVAALPRPRAPRRPVDAAATSGT